MTICQANTTHISGMLNLLRQVGQVHRDIRPDIFRDGAQKYDEAALVDILSDEKRPIFVADEDGKVAGYCFCVIKAYRGSGVQTERTELYIDDLCVDKNCRGKGIATALYRHTCAYARELGCTFITLNVWCGNDGAMTFYKKMGMKERSITMELPL